MKLHFEKHMSKGAKKKSALLTASLILLLVALVGGTIALLVDVTGLVTNTFNIVEIPNEVLESFDGTTKNNVSIKNSNTQGEPAYIRAAVVVTWAQVDDSGNATGVVYSTVPVLDTDANNGDYTLVMGDSAKWVKGADGFYYYTEPVASQAATDVLIASCAVANVDSTTGRSPNQPEGYVLSVEIAAQSIQADGMSSDSKYPVILAWGEDKGGCVTAVDPTTGALTIKTA